jgi:hypothetical protein
MNPTVKARWTKLDVDAIVKQVEADEAVILQQARTMAKEILDRNIGTQYYSLPALAAMGHPYGWHGSGRPGGLPAGVVNRQSGEFRDSFIVRVTVAKRTTLTIYQSGMRTLGIWLREGTHGKHAMRGRPWEQHLRNELARTVIPFIDTNLKRRLRLRVKRYNG